MAQRRRRVFLSMPLNNKSLGRTVQDLCNKLGMELVGPEGPVGEELHAYLAKELNAADIVIADMKNHRPNVLFEVGFAAALGKRILMIGKPPSDLKGHIWISFSHNAGLRDRLDKVLRENIDDIPEVVVGSEQRTGLITTAIAGEKGEKTIIRYQGFMGPFGLGSEDMPFHDERTEMEAFLARKGLLRMVVSPVTKDNPARQLPTQTVLKRTQNLLDFLASGMFKSRVEVVVSPSPVPNRYIIGGAVMLDGFTQGFTNEPGGGYVFNLTLRYLHPDTMACQIKEFDSHFKRLASASGRHVQLESGRLKHSDCTVLATIAQNALKESLKYIRTL
jgi:nucleoside 2-deoxyribosyltransferase